MTFSRAIWALDLNILWALLKFWGRLVHGLPTLTPACSDFMIYLISFVLFKPTVIVAKNESQFTWRLSYSNIHNVSKLLWKINWSKYWHVRTIHSIKCPCTPLAYTGFHATGVRYGVLNDKLRVHLRPAVLNMQGLETACGCIIFVLIATHAPISTHISYFGVIKQDNQPIPRSVH